MSHSKGEILIFRRGHQRILNYTPVRDEESSLTSREKPGSTEHARKGSSAAPQAQENILHWRDLTYDISIKGTPIRILDHVDGWVKPGTLTALMVSTKGLHKDGHSISNLMRQQGATGAGNTTLLDVLADRVHVGVVSGDVFVNGYPRERSFQRQTGYVQQQDVHLETSTVREALRFSAVLRQSSAVSTDKKHSYVEEVIQLLGMNQYADAVIGVPGEGTGCVLPRSFASNSCNLSSVRGF